MSCANCAGEPILGTAAQKKTAASESGLAIVRPGILPAGISDANLRFGVMPKTTATFTFSADKTRQNATRIGRTPPPMPANIDGSKLFITGGPAVVQFYADVPLPNVDPRASPKTTTTTPGSGPFWYTDPPLGVCAVTDEIYNLHINVRSGQLWSCSGLTWVNVIDGMMAGQFLSFMKQGLEDWTAASIKL